MTYRELQNQLKQFKLDGLTEIKLTEKKEVLQTEYDRIIEQLEIDKMIEDLGKLTTESCDKEEAEQSDVEIGTETLTQALNEVLKSYNANKIVTEEIINIALSKNQTYEQLMAEISCEVNMSLNELIEKVDCHLKKQHSFNPKYYIPFYRQYPVRTYLEYLTSHQQNCLLVA